LLREQDDLTVLCLPVPCGTLRRGEDLTLLSVCNMAYYVEDKKALHFFVCAMWKIT